MPKKIVQELIDLNRAQSERFMDPGQAAARRRYRAEHPTEIICFKCMDGRINLPLMTRTPMGIIHPFRNIGGIFDLGWPALSARLNEIVDWSIVHGKQNLVLVTYHWSAGDNHRGCRGQDYDTDRARTYAAGLVRQVETVYGVGHEQVYPILIGIETDEERLTFHGRDQHKLFLCGEISAESADTPGPGKDANGFGQIVVELYPDMSSTMRTDLLPLLGGNAMHQRELAQNPRPVLDLQHRERVIALGQGFDWLHRPNFAIIVGDFDPNMDDTVVKAAGIIKANRDAGRIPSSGGLLLASVRYDQPGHHRMAAMARARWLTAWGMESIRKYDLKLAAFFQPVTAVCDWNTRTLEFLKD